MKAAEILRHLIDLLDQEESTTTQPVVININNGNVDDNKETIEEPIDDNVGTFVPPLQQKIELMKKDQGIESIYDDSDETDGQSDELHVIKKIAGIMPISTLGSE